MTIRLNVPCVMVAVVLLLSPGPGLAQTDTDLARKYFELGQNLYNRADYQGALEQFKKAYQYSNKAALLYNMARCSESLGLHQQAVDYYSEYLKSNPPQPEIIRSRINNLRRLLTTNQPAVPPTPAPESDPPLQETASPGVEPPAPSSQPLAAPTATPPARSTPGRPWRTIGWISAGTGAALVISGTVLGAMARAKAKDLEQAHASSSMTYDEAMAEENSGKRLQTAQIATLAIGGAAVVGGAILLLLDYRQQGSEKRAWISPSLSPRGAWVAGGFRF